jgi:hypothetical protein
MTSPADPRPPGPDPKGPAAPINPSGTAGRLLNQITTRWSIVNDPAKVVVRYAPAIRSYLEAILRNPNDADEVAQEFALHVLNHKFDKASPDRGRFRDYVKVSARNAALIYLRKKTRAGKATALTADVERTLANPAAGNDPAAAACWTRSGDLWKATSFAPPATCTTRRCVCRSISRRKIPNRWPPGLPRPRAGPCEPTPSASNCRAPGGCSPNSLPKKWRQRSSSRRRSRLKKNLRSWG